MRRALPLAALALLLAGCGQEMDRPSNVHDLRVLAIEASPSEVYLAREAPLFKIRALVVDASAYLRTRTYRFSICPSPERMRCDGQADEKVLAEGSFIGEVIEGQFLLPLDEEYLKKLVDADTYHGFGGLQVLITLHVASEGEEVFAGKRVVLQLPAPLSVDGEPANRNPSEPQMLLGVAGTALPADERTEVRGVEVALDVATPDPSERETYLVPTFDGGARELKEAWEYSWFTTKGHFSPEQTAGFNPISQKEEPTDTKLVLDGEQAGEFVVWLVVRDGRGGETWSKRAFRWMGP